MNHRDAELTKEMRNLRQGDHVCLIYETPEQQRAAMIPFYVEGLARQERCLWIADDRTVDEVKSFLFAAGIDIEEASRRGIFTVLTKRETYLKDGSFDPNVMIEMLDAKIKETMALGFKGLRSSGEMTWALGDEEGCSRAMEYESLLNNFFPGQPFIGICQYNKCRFHPTTSLEVLRNHHFAIIGEKVCPNLYFEPTEMALNRSSKQAQLDWKLSQLIRAREATQTLERTVRAREAFLTIANHELRTPITALKLQLQVLEHNVHAIEISHIQKALAQTQRLKELSERLLDMTQLYGEGMNLQYSKFDLADVAREVASEYANRTAGSQLELEVASSVGHWDAIRMRQVVDNLLSNAFKYGANKPIHLKLRTNGSMTELIVADEGIGIDSTDHGRIFGPFERAVSEDNYTGFGVGLWLVQQIVSSHGGTIELESALGHGTTFSVCLPRERGVLN